MKKNEETDWAIQNWKESESSKGVVGHQLQNTKQPGEWSGSINKGIAHAGLTKIHFDLYTQN